MDTRNTMQGKVALVTGAGRGLGLAIARLLKEEGATVYVSDLNSQGIQHVAAQIGARAGLKQDVTVAVDWDRAIDRIIAESERLDVLVNNAGIARLQEGNAVDDISADTWQAIMRVNAEGTMLGCRIALRVMKQSGGGSIVNISSIAGMMPTPTIAAYGASKAAVTHLTRSVALFGAPHQIRCNSVHPGMIRSAMLADLFQYHAAKLSLSEDPEMIFLAAIPMGRFQEERDVAEAVRFLACDESRYVTGAQLIVDGGMSLK